MSCKKCYAKLIKGYTMSGLEKKFPSYFNNFELPEGAEEQEIIYSCDMMLQEERRQRSALGKLYGLKIYTMPYPQVKKIAYLKDHITGL